MSIDPAKVTQLKEFVTLCNAQPAILNLPELEFFKEWLLSLSAELPPVVAEPPKQQNAQEEVHVEPPSPPSTDEDEEETAVPEPPKTQPMKESTSEESEESELEMDTEGTIPPDNDPPQQMGDPSTEVSEEMEEKARELRGEAMMAAGEGDLEKVVELFTSAILSNPKSALLYAKRASIYVRMEKPNAAIRDCAESIRLNPDSAQGYKWRGKAHCLLGHWEDASKDLQMSCRLDYDDDANAALKEIKSKVEKIREHKLKKERKQREKEVRDNLRRRREAQERAREDEELRRKRERAEKMSGGIPGGGMPPGMSQIFSDPELMQMMQDPEVTAAFLDVQKNPENAKKYENNPKVKKVMETLSATLGATGMGGAGMGGAGMGGAGMGGAGMGGAGMGGAGMGGAGMGGAGPAGPPKATSTAQPPPPNPASDMDLD